MSRKENARYTSYNRIDKGGDGKKKERKKTPDA
jgi:hypothetical protein